MRTSNPTRFRVARRGTSREINRQIVLNLVREREPISRADLARAMGVRRGGITRIVDELLQRGLLREGATGEAARGRKPTFLYIASQRQTVVAVDIRASRTYFTLTDLLGRPLTGIASFPTVRDPRRLAAAIAARTSRLLADERARGTCAGIGVVVPGMVEPSTLRVLHAPTLGWRNVNLRELLAGATRLPVFVENSGRACALAQMFAVRDEPSPGNLVFVSVSDGVGVGVVIRGEVLRGRHNIAGEFGHAPLSLDGPPCSCGSTGCWEAYISNRATLARYFGRTATRLRAQPRRAPSFSVGDLIARARGGDAKASAALNATARYLGLGLATIVNTLDPARIYVGGEITGAWDLIEPVVRAALAERVLASAAATIELHLASAGEHPRLLGAAALVASPAFDVPVVA